MRYLLCWLVLVPVVLTGCEEDVVSVLGTERAYTLYGVLNPKADTQFVRVYLIEQRLERTTPEPLDARFTSTDLTTGEVLVWRDSVVVDPDGGYGHIFWAPFRAGYDHDYRLDITGGDGRASSATIDVPEEAQPELGDPLIIPNVLLPVYVRGNVARLINTELSFLISYVNGFTATGTPLVRVDTLIVPYDDRVSRVSDGLLVQVNLTSAYREVIDLVRRDRDYEPAYGVDLRSVFFDAVVANEAWQPPPGGFDPNVLVQPGTLSNVENGFGFVGAGYRVQIRWRPPDTAMAQAGFRTFS